MSTIKDCLLAANVCQVERIEADLLLGHVLDRPRSWLFAHADGQLATDEQAAFVALLKRRAAGEPVAYLLGRGGFWSLELEVTADTLIPRVESELLVELSLRHVAPDAVARVADLGTGSGALALALARERPLALITAVDISAGALAVARRNAQRLALHHVAFVRGNWMDPLVQRCFDVIVANPPYVEAGDPHLRRGDLRFEPRDALVSGADGLDAIRHIVGTARFHLRMGGWLLFEHGANQGEAARVLLRDAGYDEVFTAQDLEQRDRVSGGWVPA